MYSLLSLAVASAEEAVPLIDMDNTVWIELVLFLLVVAVLSRFLFRPYLQLRDARDASIEGARKEAHAMQQDAAQRVADYEARLAQARQRGAEERARIRAEGAAREREVIAAARDEVTRSLELARGSLATQAAKLRGELAPRAGELGRTVARKLLGREV